MRPQEASNKIQLANPKITHSSNAATTMVTIALNQLLNRLVRSQPLTPVVPLGGRRRAATLTLHQFQALVDEV